MCCCKDKRRPGDAATDKKDQRHAAGANDGVEMPTLVLGGGRARPGVGVGVGSKRDLEAGGAAIDGLAGLIDAVVDERTGAAVAVASKSGSDRRGSSETKASGPVSRVLSLQSRSMVSPARIAGVDAVDAPLPPPDHEHEDEVPLPPPDVPLPPLDVEVKVAARHPVSPLGSESESDMSPPPSDDEEKQAESDSSMSPPPSDAEEDDRALGSA